ncbi:MAG TPA: HD-GYP domain-containing protein [Chloroflexota bacterium]|nr:HD-GYP domain-containing protein [Chloroflexota bacterium]
MGRRAATMPQRRMMASDKLEEGELMRVYAQANQYAEELRRLYLERRATQAELEQKVRELERSQKQMLAYAHDLAGINRRLQTTYLQTLAALARTVDHRDGITGDHCLHVAEYSRILGARLLDNDRDQLRQLECGALLHDIGKIAIPDAILRKAGPLEEQEWQVMRRHPELGCQMLEGIDFLEEALPIVRHHHERHDGEGYPDGLKGDAIPIGARIFAVADAFDAMTSDRHYRRARSVDHAVSELKRHSATQFDPQVIEVLETVAEELVSSHESRGAGSE